MAPLRRKGGPFAPAREEGRDIAIEGNTIGRIPRSRRECSPSGRSFNRPTTGFQSVGCVETMQGGRSSRPLNGPNGSLFRRIDHALTAHLRVSRCPNGEAALQTSSVEKLSLRQIREKPEQRRS